MASSLSTLSKGTQGAQMAGVSSAGPVVIASVFGRGHWLAHDLAKKGWSVSLIDLSSAFPSVDPGLAEGPFGLFESNDLLPAQKDCLASESELISVRAGFSFWLHNGPYELRSPFAEIRRQSLGLSASAVSYVSNLRPPDKESEKVLRALVRQPYATSWIAHLAHQVFSNRVEENYRALEIGYAAPLKAEFSIRRMNLQGRRKGLLKLKEAGVQVYEAESIEGFNQSKGSQKEDVGSLVFKTSLNSILGDEIKEPSPSLHFQACVWMLSSLETEKVSVEMSKKFFPKGVIEPQLYWQRFQIQLTGNRPIETFPLHTVLVNDVYLPIMNLNCLILRRAASGRIMDVWVRVPYLWHEDVSKLKKIQFEIKNFLSTKMPAYFNKANDVNVEAGVEAKSASNLNESEIAPVTFALNGAIGSQAIYSVESIDRLHPMKAPGFYFCGPERSDSLDWLGLFRSHGAVIEKLDRLKNQLDLAARRKAAKEANL